MRFNKTHLFVFIAGVVLGLCAGFFSGKAIYDKPIEESVTRDTVTLHDTIPDIAPVPKDSTPVRTIIRWLPMSLPKKSGTNESVDNPYPESTDTVTQWQYFGIAEHFADTSNMIPVEVPITSKHYSSKDYDAWVSGFEPSLDSILVYQKTEYITKTVTLSKPPNKWEFDIVGGTDYGITSKQWLPFAGGELTLNNHKRLKIGIEGGVKRNETTKDFEPYASAKLRLRVF